MDDVIILDQDAVKEKDGKITVDFRKFPFKTDRFGNIDLSEPQSVSLTVEFNPKTGEWEEVIDE